jgi:hypothetical protein
MKETKFAVRYIPTGQWVYLSWSIGCYVHLMDTFSPDGLYSARNILEEDLSYAFNYDTGERVKSEDVEIVEIEVEYKLP